MKTRTKQTRKLQPHAHANLRKCSRGAQKTYRKNIENMKKTRFRNSVPFWFSKRGAAKCDKQLGHISRLFVFPGIFGTPKKAVFSVFVFCLTQKNTGKRLVCRHRHAFLMMRDRSMLRKVNEVLHTSRGGLKLSHG